MPIEAQTRPRIIEDVLFIDVATCHAEDMDGLTVETCLMELRAFLRDGSRWRWVDTIPVGLRQHEERLGDDICRYSQAIVHRIPVDHRGGRCVEIGEPTTRVTTGLSCAESRGCAVSRRLPSGRPRDTMPTSAQMWDGAPVPDLRGAWHLEDSGWRRTPSCDVGP